MLKKTGILAGIIGYYDASKADRNPDFARAVRRRYGLKPDANTAMREAGRAELDALRAGLYGAAAGGLYGLYRGVMKNSLSKARVLKPALKLALPAYVFKSVTHPIFNSRYGHIGSAQALAQEKEEQWKKSIAKNPVLRINDYDDFEYLDRVTKKPIPRTDPVYKNRPHPSNIMLGQKLLKNPDYDDDSAYSNAYSWIADR